MINLIIDSPIIENFYYQECNEDNKTFIEKMTNLIEINKVKSTINIAFKELELIKNGQLDTIPIDEVLKHLDD
jgi:hypothetical protein